MFYKCGKNNKYFNNVNVLFWQNPKQTFILYVF